MTLQRWGAYCDGMGCDEALPLSQADKLAVCHECGLDLCDTCVRETGHTTVTEAEDGHRPTAECAGQ